MEEIFYIGQIFEGIYPVEAANWCNQYQKIMVEIDPINKDVEEEYEDVEEVVVPETEVDGEIIPEHTEQKTVTKTRTVNKLVRRFQIQEIPEPSEEEIKQARIAELKSELNSTDYKIIKCSECSLAGEELPYNIAELHVTRQALRDEINELENE